MEARLAFSCEQCIRVAPNYHQIKGKVNRSKIEHISSIFVFSIGWCKNDRRAPLVQQRLARTNDTERQNVFSFDMFWLSVLKTVSTVRIGIEFDENILRSSQVDLYTYSTFGELSSEPSPWLMIRTYYTVGDVHDTELDHSTKFQNFVMNSTTVRWIWVIRICFWTWVHS